ncbi:MAG: SRPBCC domain-containing protein, partial [Terrimesophilobacter sp.]
VDTVYPTLPDDLWEAITSPERLARWFGELVPRSDEATVYDATLTTGWSGPIRVDQCEPTRVIRVTLLDEDPSAVTTVTAVLDATDGGTRLTIEERGLPTEDLPTYVAGWHAQLDQLHADFSGAPAIEWRPRWEHLRETYRNNQMSQR